MISNKGGLVRIKRSLSAIIATLFIAAVPLAASAQFSVGVGFTVGSPPPPIPYYSQPPAPYPNYQWQPGYWAWGPAGYYWVPGTWVAPPSVGMYWTPGYWGATVGGGYGWNGGYWGASVGFYGGINYGYGYPGTGFYGGVWNGGTFGYNTAVMNVNRTVIHNTYNKTIVNNGNFCRNCRNVSYNGGKGGITAKPTPAQLDARRHGIAPTTDQRKYAQVAAENRNLYAGVNHGKPPVTAVDKPITDPKSFPHYAPVTAADKQRAQAEVKHANTANGATGHAPETTKMQTAPHHNQPSGTMTTHHNAPETSTHKQPPPGTMTKHHNQPPSGTMHSNAMHSNTMHSQGGMYGHPQGHPQGEMNAHPQGGKPPSNGNGGKDKNKPPRG